MSTAQSFAHYCGIQVKDIWQNTFLVTKDLLTSHDLKDCEFSMIKCPMQVEYFLQSIHPFSIREQIWLEIYQYAMSGANADNPSNSAQLLKDISEMLLSGNLMLFKVVDGLDTSHVVR